MVSLQVWRISSSIFHVIIIFLGNILTFLLMQFLNGLLSVVNALFLVWGNEDLIPLDEMQDINFVVIKQ